MKQLIIILLIFLTGCTTTKIVEVPVEKTKIEYKDKLVHDSIYIKENTNTHTRNDTIFVDKYKYIYKEKIVNDTIILRDSIPLIIEIETIKEVNKLKNWQVILMIIGGLSIGLFIGFIIKKIRIL